MTPEQMAAMAAQMSPEQIRQAQAMMSNMSPEQLRNIENMAQKMGLKPPGGMPPPGVGSSAQEKYQFNAAMMLKNEGNALHSRGEHSEAIKKYERARSNIEGQSTAEAAELRKACILNTAMCHLKLENFRDCVQACNDVLKYDPRDLKALYRRGQAHLGLEAWQAAKRDLRQAVELAANDPVQLPLIQAKLDVATAHCSDDVAEYRDGDVTIEDVTDEPSSSAPRQDGGSSSRNVGSQPATAAAPQMPAMSDAQRAAAAQMAEQNPEQLQQMAEMLDNMSDADFEQMQRMSGMPGIDRNAAKQAAAVMKGMSPEQLKHMAQMASSRTAPGSFPAVSPEQMAGVADMMRDLPPEQLQAMAAASGMDMSPDMIKMATEAMKNMRPEDVAELQKMSAQMGGLGGQAGPSGRGGGAPDVAAMLRDPNARGSAMSMMSDPKAMESAMKMMSSMDEDSLVNMIKMAQPNLDEAAVRKAAQSMKSMDERSMKMMLRLASGAHSAWERVQRARAWLLARPGVLVALVLLLVAILLRVFGVL